MIAFVSKKYKIGDKIDFSLCEDKQQSYGHIFFKIGGGWGIAKENGEVIYPNNLRYPLSSHHPSILPFKHIGFIDNSLVIVRNVETDCYGVLSLKYAKEILPCKYNFIEPIRVEHPAGDNVSSKNELFFLVKEHGNTIEKFDHFCNDSYINGVWGVYKETGELLINVRYNKIEFHRGYIECHTYTDHIYEDTYIASCHAVGYSQKYFGKIDLYKDNGDFIVGGLDLISYEGNYIKLYIGTKYSLSGIDIMHEEEWGYPVTYEVHYNVPEFDDAACLIIDEQLNPVLKKSHGIGLNEFEVGMTFKDKENFLERLSGETIIKGCSVDMRAFDRNYLFLKFPNDIFFVSDFQNNSGVKRTIEVLCNGQPEYIDIPKGKWVDTFVEESVVVIAKISEDGSISWSHRVNDVDLDDAYRHIFYREGDKVGELTEKGLKEARYSAISKRLLPNGNQVVAIINNKHKKEYFRPDITYYELNEKDELIKIVDTKYTFEPIKYQWYPNNFYEDYLYYEPDDLDAYGDGKEFGWTKEMLEEAMDIAFEGHSPLELGLE